MKIEYPKKYNEKKKRYENDVEYIKGSQIKTTKGVQNILFKNADYDMIWSITATEIKG